MVRPPVGSTTLPLSLGRLSRQTSLLLTMRLSFLAAALLFFIVGLHAQWISEVDDRIKQFNVSGPPAVGGEFPYMAVLRLNGYLCEGTLVGPSHILTAAQCLFDRPTTEAMDYQVLLNTLTTDGDAGVVNVGVKNFIIHENFNPITMDNDVALLVLKSPVTDVPTVTLPETPDKPQPITTEPTTIPTTTTKTTTTKKPTTTKTTTTKKPTTTSKMTTKPTTTTKTTTKPTSTTKTTTKPTTKTTTKTTTKPTTKTTTKTTTKPTTKTTKTTAKPTTKTTTKTPTTKPTTKRTTTKKKTRFLQIPSESMSDLVRFDNLFNGKITNRASGTYAGSQAVIIGWGTSIFPGGSISNTLLKADVVVEDNAICASRFPNFVGDDMLCATFTGSVNPPTENPITTSENPLSPSPSTANPLCSPALSDLATKLVPLRNHFNKTAGRVQTRANTCQQGTDIGGPLFVDGVQVGMNSVGYNIDCADPSYTGVYTRVTTYLDWIATTMANNM